MMHSRIQAKPLTLDMLHDVEGLQQTAAQVSLLLELASKALAEFRSSAGRRHSDLAECGDWDDVTALLMISDQLLDRVRDVSAAMEAAAYPDDLA